MVMFVATITVVHPPIEVDSYLLIVWPERGITSSSQGFQKWLRGQSL